MSRPRHNWAVAVLNKHGDIQAWDHADGATVADLREVMGWAAEDAGAQVALVKLIGDCDCRTDWFPSLDDGPIFEDGSAVPKRFVKQWRSRHGAGGAA
ncbi:MAG TPA: hypothetical protein DF699_16730 [Phycisphaerales bacterium]|nr:hypothetical protein [Phycisphaerales bacterium]